jgi:hypothetical protein
MHVKHVWIHTCIYTYMRTTTLCVCVGEGGACVRVCIGNRKLENTQ